MRIVNLEALSKLLQYRQEGLISQSHSAPALCSALDQVVLLMTSVLILWKSLQDHRGD